MIPSPCLSLVKLCRDPMPGFRRSRTHVGPIRLVSQPRPRGAMATAVRQSLVRDPSGTRAGYTDV